MRRIVAAGCLALVAACTPGDGAQRWLGEVRELPSPGDPGSRYPHLATAPDGTVVMSWLQPRDDGGHELRYAEWQGGEWSAASTVATRS